MLLLAMFGIGPEEFLVLFILFGFILLLSFLRHSSVIVISRKIINPQGPLYIQIQGRRAGFFSWLLKLCRIESAITLSINKDRIEFNEDSFFGQRTDFIPLKNVSTLGVSYSSSSLTLVLAVILFFFGIFAFFAAEVAFPSVILLICAGISFVAYILSKRHGISVCAPGFNCQLLVQRSLIEGESLTPIDQEMIRQIFRLRISPDSCESESGETTVWPQISEPSTKTENPGFEVKGAARRGFSSVIPTPPVPPIQPPLPPQLRR